MSTNKNAQLRYQVLDRCFSDRHRRYEIQDLVDKVNETLFDLCGTKVSLRQIRDDIKYMRDRVTFDAPIVAVPFDGKKCYYTYEDPDFSIFNNELSAQEVTNLRSTIEMLGKYRGAVGMEWLEEVISNLEYRFGVKSNSRNVVSFEQNRLLQGLNHLSAIIDSAVNRQPLDIVYRTYSGKEKLYTIHPYHVKQYNNRWYLFGLEMTERGGRIANRALDRIVKCTKAEIPFIENTMVDFSTYFDDIVGVTVPGEDVGLETIVLKFDRARFPYIKSKPLHPSQTVLSEDDCTLRIEVRPNKELESELLSFGPQVEVLQPSSLREKIAKKIEENLKIYFPVKDGRTDESHLCGR